MKLYEFEAKQLFRQAGIPVPEGKLLRVERDLVDLEFPVILKAQTLSGGRGKKGLIKPVKDLTEAKSQFKSLLGREIGVETVESVLAETYLINKEAEFYLSITYDTESRRPVALVSKKGGVDIEEIVKQEKALTKVSIDPTLGLQSWQARQALAETGFSGIHFLTLSKILISLWDLFIKVDARLVEINPLIETADEEFYAADAKVILDDDASFRHEDPPFPPRNELGRAPTEAELNAKEIDKNDHRGSAGSSYIELSGDIAVIAAGGGGSLVNMDALIALGGKPANYTEHSGNPPAEKIEKLTKIVLSKKNLIGCWFVGATANFTDIYETLSGFVNGLRSIRPKPDYPIVVRRGGPRYEEAFAMLKKVGKEEGFDFHLFGPETPMTSTAKVIVDLASDYKKRKLPK